MAYVADRAPMLEVASEIQDIDVDSLRVMADALAAGIRDRTRKQIEIWRTLPYLALQANDDTVLGDFNVSLYTYGMLYVAGQSPKLDGIFVDCDTGEIVKLGYGEPLPVKPASPQEVIETWLPHGKSLDAQTWHGRLFDNTVPRLLNDPTGEQIEMQRFREYTLNSLGLEPIYYRKPSR